MPPIVTDRVAWSDDGLSPSGDCKNG